VFFSNIILFVAKQALLVPHCIERLQAYADVIGLEFNNETQIQNLLEETNTLFHFL